MRETTWQRRRRARSKVIYSTYVYQIEFSQVKQRNVLRPRPSYCIGHPRLDLDLARSLGGILHASAHSRGRVTYTPKYSCSLLSLPLSLYPLWSDCLPQIRLLPSPLLCLSSFFQAATRVTRRRKRRKPAEQKRGRRLQHRFRPH